MVEELLDVNGAIAFDQGKARVSLDLRIYRLTAIQKTTYRFAREFGAILGPIDGDVLNATLEFPPAMPDAQVNRLLRSFFEDLLDQELRERIAEETHALRALVLAQAFSMTDLIRRD
ncbi:MAG: His-Xaa-Ser system protein HxsD [Polyangiaceae bacterium]